MSRQPQTSKALSVVDLFDIVRRRKTWLLVTALLVMSGVSIYAFVAKERFKARTLVSIEAPPDPARPFVDPAARMQEHMRLVNEVLFSESVFRPIVEEFHLADKTARSPQRDLEEIKERVKIDVDGSTAFYISFEGPERKQVADVANRFAQQLSIRTSARQERRNEKETAVIDAEVERLRGVLANLDGRISQYKQSAVDELPERVDANLKLLETLNTQLRDNSSATASEEARRAGVVAEMNELEKEGHFQVETPVVKSANAEKLEATRADLQRLKARGFTSAYPEVDKLEDEVARLQALVAAEKPATPVRTPTPAGLRYTALKAELETIDRRLVSLRQQRSPISGQLGDYSRRVNSAPRHEGALSQLKMEYNIARDQYEDQLTRQSVARQHDQIEKIDHGVVFRIVEPARAPLDPYSPNRLYLLMVGIGGALGLGFGLVFLVESADSTFKDVEDLQAKTGLPVLTMVPRIKELPRKKREEVNRGLKAQGITALPEDSIVPLVDPKSVPAEQYQILATRLRRRMKPDAGFVIMVTSSAGGEGKTVTSVNLATSLAGSGASVLLIDADLRRPRVHQYLGLGSREGQGLGAFLSSPDGDISKVASKVGGLTVLCSKHPVSNALNILGSPKLPVLIDRLRTQFQFIVIDSPPVLPLADGMVLGNLADRVLLVVRAYQTTLAVLRRALDGLDSQKLAGVILNDVDMKHSRYNYVYRYYENTYLRGA